MGAKNSGVPSSMSFPIFIPGTKLKIAGIYIYSSLFSARNNFQKEN